MAESVLRLGFEEIKNIIPQRFPFLMLDRIEELRVGVKAVGLKNLTGNEVFYQGHFPERAVTPGVMIGEAIAQTGIVYLHYSSKATPRQVVYLLGSLKIRFHQPAWPGDQLRIEVRPIKVVSNAGILQAKVLVGNQVIAQGEFSLSAKEHSAL